MVYVFATVTSFKLIEHVVFTVSPAGGPDFPKVRHHHAFEVGSGGAQFWPMEDRLAGFQLLKYFRQSRIGNHEWGFCIAAHGAILISRIARLAAYGVWFQSALTATYS